MTAIVFILYLLLFCLLIPAIPFFKNSGLGKGWIISLFIIKVCAGLVYAWFYSLPAYRPGSDTWRFFELSIAETNLLLHHPWDFIKDLFHFGYDRSGNLFAGENSYWNDLKDNMMLKLMALMNVFTFKNYYANIIFFNFLFFFGPVAFYRMMHESFQGKKIWLIAFVFLIPSFLFWCSGIHKDGLIFSAIALVMYFFRLQLMKEKLQLKYVLPIIVFLLILFTLRNFIVMLLIPALTAWAFSHYYPEKKWLIFLGIYGLGIIVFFSAYHITPGLNFPQYIINKQQEFLQIAGNSKIDIPKLEPELKSFIQFLPVALDIGFLQPHLIGISNKSYFPAAMENFSILILIGYALFFIEKKTFLSPQVLFCIFFSLSVILLAGYCVPFSATVIRYKSIVLPLLLTPFGLVFSKQKA